MGWTGGQYSLYRAALAVAVGAELLAAAGAVGGLPAALLLALGAVLVVALAAGARDRIAALLLAPLVVGAELAARTGASSGASAGGAALGDGTLADALLAAASGGTALLSALLLLLHARVPAAPFGSLAARDRTDPRGGWQRPAVQTSIGWALLCGALAAGLARGIVAGTGGAGTGATAMGAEAVAAAGFALVVAVVGFSLPRLRPAAWSALALFGLAWLAASGTASDRSSLARALLLVFACEPAWWRGRRLTAERAGAANATSSTGAASTPHATPPHEASAVARPARLFYDGDCGFCHRSVRFILSEELATPEALRLRFAPLGSEPFRDCLARHPELDATSLPDSIVLELEDGVVLTRSAAALEIASRLGGFWRLLALAGRLVPKALLDAGYDGIARIRKRLFAQPKDACPILPKDLRARFDA